MKKKIIWYKSIQFKLQISIILIFILAIGSILATNYYSGKEDLEASLKIDLQNQYRQVIDHIDTASLRAMTLATWVANTKDVQEIFKEKNRDALRSLMLPKYKKIKKELNINQFQFHLPPATSFLRLHKPSKFGDDLSGLRPTIVEVNSSKKPIKGLDRGRFGIGMRGLSPVFNGNDHIGSVEFGMSLNDVFLGSLKEMYDINAGIVAKDASGIYKLMAKNYPFSNPESMFATYSDVISSGKFKAFGIDSDNKHIFYLIGPLKDFSGKNEGVVIIEKDITEYISKMDKLLLIYSGIGFGFVCVLVLCLMSMFRILLNSRLKRFATVLKKAADGDLTIRSTAAKSDEMGIIGETLNHYLEVNHNVIKNLEENIKILEKASTGLDSTSGNMNGHASTFSAHTTEIESASSETNHNINSIAAAIEETAINVEEMSKRFEFLSNSLQGISRETTTAGEISNKAAETAHDVSGKMESLKIIVNDINKVTETINDISEQTNLLALNATIEAARAGEAGKGFAVVAGEIKALAAQTGNATGDIQQKINNIQQATMESMHDIKKITEVINEMDGIVNNIAENVTEQSSKTIEISKNYDEATLGLKETSESISVITAQTHKSGESIAELNGAAASVENESKDVSKGASEVNMIASKLKKIVDDFKI